MKNVQMSLDPKNKNILIIKVDLSERHGKSQSGKTTIVASTEGNVAAPENELIKIGLNIYTK